jgi:hypothetical protein
MLDSVSDFTRAQSGRAFGAVKWQRRFGETGFHGKDGELDEWFLRVLEDV